MIGGVLAVIGIIALLLIILGMWVLARMETTLKDFRERFGGRGLR